VHDDLRGNLLARRQRGDRSPSRALDGRNLLTEAKGHGVIAKMEFQRFDDLGVTELQHLRTLLDERHSGAKCREDGRILDSDDAGAHDNE
jgi:hypothetical protein